MGGFLWGFALLLKMVFQMDMMASFAVMGVIGQKL
jgi:hypothetical protein